ncbi:DUF1573 domain-containing protein [Tenacibaculum tangerinum]|uniref:DUF1573 domain-containing protein n=1 Tax=Tenacibaculum tangerinum TaxID=3038772 RepID=A0ABY8L680_9FLAO|nr:DUF1573 domain-containing protein [Tenacibaculum tangerinum]WGH75690.1 DUF1573 domain-containing protein [Tenacibaculum tangerinum]
MKKSNNPVAKAEILEKDFDFGEITLQDTIAHSFKIKNTTDIPLKINNLATSCGCTTFDLLDSIAKKDESLTVTVQFIPKEEHIGQRVSNSVVVEMNTDPPFSVVRLKGKVLSIPK